MSFRPEDFYRGIGFPKAMLKRSGKITAAFLFGLLCVESIPAPLWARTVNGPSRTRLLLLDVCLPGYGSFYHERYVPGALIATGRVLSLYFAGVAWKEAREYRSAARAAKNADLYYGPGFKYKDPYGGGFSTADEFHHKADRKALTMGLAITAHILITAFSVFMVTDLHEQERMKNLPVFEIQSETAPAKSTGIEKPERGFRFTLTAIRRDF